MERIRTIEEAVAKMEKSVRYYQCRVDAWAAVKRVYKKDGGAFAVLSKNFTGCKFSGDTKVVVYFRDENDRFCDDYINIFLWAEGRVMTPDEVQAEIEKTVANYTKWRDIDTNGAENIADDLRSMIPALDGLKALINDMKADNTHYTARAFIKEYLDIL